MALGAVAVLALTAPTALAQQVSQAGSVLPPPPYARDTAQPTARRPASYGGEQAYDRYGGGALHPRVAAIAAPSGPTMPVAYTGPRLGWTGKTEAAPRSATVAAPYEQTHASGRPDMGYPAQGGMTPRLAAQPAIRQAAGPGPQPRAGFAASQPAAPQGWTYVQPIGAGAQVQPRSIYDAPPPPAAPPVQLTQAMQGQAPQAQSGQSGARHYSVNREFGQQPDPIPLPPQFFGNTADLTQPATDEPDRKVSTANGKTRNALQPEGGQ